MRRIPLAVALLVVFGFVLASSSSAGSSSRPPRSGERIDIVHAIKDAWRTQPEFSAVRKLGLHPVVTEVRVSRLDRHFASASVVPADGHGTQKLETVKLLLIKAGAGWTGWRIFWSGTDDAYICVHPADAPSPVLELICR